MSYNVKIGNLIGALLIVALCSFPVNAATMSIENMYYGYANGNTGISVTYKGESLGTFAGLLKVNYEGFDTWGFCVDLDTSLGLGTDLNGTTSFTYTTTSDPVVYADNLVYVEWLLNTFAEEAYDQGDPWSTDGAALQLAIWEVLYDYGSIDGLNYGSDGDITYTSNGNFYYDRSALSAVDTKANDYYDDYINALIVAIQGELDSSYVSSGNYVVVQLDNAQDIIVNTVPEPTTALLLGLGLLGLCAVGRKRA